MSTVTIDSDGNGTEAARLEKRLARLEREVVRLVKAIRTTDAPELLQELSSARGERDVAKGALAEARQTRAVEDPDAEAERMADTLWELGGRFRDAEPAELRELFHRAVSRIVCRWETEKKKNRVGTRLVGGRVELRDFDPAGCFNKRSWQGRSIVLP